jgi:hypothetical protein
VQQPQVVVLEGGQGDQIHEERILFTIEIRLAHLVCAGLSLRHEWPARLVSTPAGQVALAWERARLDDALADVFGYHALQLGLAELDALAANRMPHRWLADVAPPWPTRRPRALPW